MSSRQSDQDAWDSFAAAALTGVLSESRDVAIGRGVSGFDVVSRAADLADQMLNEREKRIKARADAFIAQVGAVKL